MPMVSDALLLALGTVVGYVTAFAYHRDYVAVFGIPPELISFDPSSFLVAATNISSFAIALGLFIGVLLLLHGPARNPVERRLRRLIPVGIISGVVLILHERQAIRLLLYFSLVVIAYYEFLRPLSKYGQVKGYMSKLQTADEEEHGLFGKLGDRFLAPVGLAILALMVVSLGSMAGRLNALEKRKFLVLGDNPDLIVPALYADKLVAVRVDRRQKKVLPEIVVITREPGKPLVLRLEEIGPLSSAGDR